MNNLKNKKIAIVCDWIKDWGGAELILEQFIELFPQADIFTSVFFQNNNEIFKGKSIKTSFIQKIPLLNKFHKLALSLRPIAFESFDFSKYDLVLTSTSAESKGVITKPDTLHITYCHTPTRYFWSHYHEYLNMMEFGFFLNIIGKTFAPKLINKLRKWDFVAGQRPDFYISNSNNTSDRIKKYYKRESEIIHPPVKTNKFNIKENKKDYFLAVGRCIPYKKFDLIVDTFNKNGKSIIIVTNTKNKLFKELKAKSNNNIDWKINISRDETINFFENAKAFIFPPEEDFGIVPLESMACGTPVIAYKKGGALETIINQKTGLFFDKQNIESLNKAIKEFEKINFNAKMIRKHAEKFDEKVFKKNIINFISDKIKY